MKEEYRVWRKRTEYEGRVQSMKEEKSTEYGRGVQSMEEEYRV